MSLPHTPDAETLAEHGGFVRALARAAVAGDDLAEDVAQETWLAAVRSQSPPRTSWRAWLRGVVRRRAADLMRAEAAVHRREGAVARHEGQPATVDLVVRAESARRMIAAVVHLDDRYRDVILLRYYEDLPPRRIAERLGLPVETVRTRLKRGLARMRTQLDAEHGGDRRSWLAGLAPFAAPGRAVSTATLIGGGLVLKKITLLVVVGALCALGLWKLRAGGDPADSSNRVVAVPEHKATLAMRRGPPSPSLRSGEEAAPSGAEEPSLRGPFRVSGRVQSKDRNPVALALVALGDLRARTGDDGTFQLQVPGGVEVAPQLALRATGFRPRVVHLPELEGANIDLGTVEVVGECRLVLEVLGDRGERLADVAVRWRRPATRHNHRPWYPGRPHTGMWCNAGRTDEAGRCELAGLPRTSEVTVFLAAPDGRVAALGPLLAQEDGAVHTVVLESTHPVRFLSSRAVAREDALLISVERKEPTHGRSWTLLLPFEAPETTRGLPAGRYEIRTWSHDAPLGTQSIDVQGPMDVRLTVERPRSLDLTLRDTDGDPISLARACLHAIPTGKSSGFEFSSVFEFGRTVRAGRGVLGVGFHEGADAHAMLSVVAPGYESVFQSVRWGAGESRASLVLELRAGAEVEGTLQGGGHRGVALRLLRGEASPVCRYVMGQDAPLVSEAVCDAAGRFLLHGLESGRYALEDRARPGRALATMELRAGSRTVWEGTYPSGRIEVTEPNDRGDRPLAILPLVDAANPHRGPVRRGTRLRGRTTFAALPEGAYLVGRHMDLVPYARTVRVWGTEPLAVSAGDLPLSVRRVDLADGKVVEVSLEAPPDPSPWEVGVILSGVLRDRQIVVAAIPHAHASTPAQPETVDWHAVDEQGRALVMFPERTPGLLVVGVPHRDRMLAPYDIVALVPFEYRTAAFEIRVAKPARLEAKLLTPELIASFVPAASPHFRWGRMVAGDCALENLMPGNWIIRLSRVERDDAGEVRRDAKGIPVVRRLEIPLSLSPGGHEKLELSMP